MKIAISGKGGTGKTTLTALLGYLYSQEGKKVFLIDADPDGNLGITLGFSQNELSKLTPISELKKLINERTENTGTGLFKLNPKVDDIPEKYSLKKDNIHFLLLGTLKKGGSGCYCPENTFLKSLLRNLIVEREEIVIIDMPAGIEHFGRGTSESVDALIIVVEPTLKSIQTAQRIVSLASDLKINKILFVGNKIINDSDLQFIKDNLSKEPIGHLSYSPQVLESEKSGIPLYQSAKQTLNEVLSIKEKLEP